MSSSSSAASNSLRVMAWAAAAVVAVLFFGPTFVRVFRPPPDTPLDFTQEWLSARCYFAGDPVYLHQREAMQRQTGRDLPVLEDRPLNAHPPVAVLVALPFGRIADYRTAHLVWNLVTFPLFLASVALILSELRVRLYWWSVFPAVVFVIANNPLLSHLWQGQLNIPILFLLVLGWAADRRGYRIAAGIAIGIAAGLKLFPGLLLVYFLAARAWRQVAALLATAAFLNVVALALFGWEAFATYVREVVPSLRVFRGSWGNASLTGYLTRLFTALGVPGAALVVIALCQAAVVGTIWWASRRATTPEDRDRGFALAVAAMPLVSPISWAHYFVILALPLLLLWQRLPSGWVRAAFFAAVIALLIPEGLYPGLYERIVPGSPDVTQLANHLPTPPDVGLCAVGLAVPTLALVVVFVLLLRIRNEPEA